MNFKVEYILLEVFQYLDESVTARKHQDEIICTCICNNPSELTTYHVPSSNNTENSFDILKFYYSSDFEQTWCKKRNRQQ